MAPNRRSLFMGLTLVGALLASLETDTQAGDPFVIIVHKANTTSTLSHSELKKIVTGGTRQWDSGAAVQVGLIPGDTPETSYLGKALDLSVRDLLGRLQEQVFKGEMRRPVVLRSSADCVALARGNPGAICVAAAGAVTPDLHVVTIH